jgi:hypothetical protein
MKCQTCNEDLDGGDVYEHYLAVTGNPKKAMKYAKLHGWSESDPIRFSRAVIVQPEGKPQYMECPMCLTPIAPQEPGSS